MALAGADFSVVKGPVGIAPGLKQAILEWTGPASYAAGGEILTKAIAAGWGMKEIHAMVVTPLVDDDGSAGAVAFNVVFDNVAPTPATDLGKLRVLSSGAAAHTHSFLVKGGAAAAGTDAISIKGTTPVTIGKEAATDATNLGGVGGGVQASTVDEHAGDVAEATDLSAFKARIVVWGA